MTEHLINIALGTLGIYALLAGTYLGLGVLMSRINRAMPHKRIQQRQCPPERVRADIVQSLKSLVLISLFTYGGMYLQQEILLNYDPDPSLWKIALLAVASLLIFDTWFYWGHRLIHTRPLYARVHKWHHISVTTTIWSNNSDTLLDDCFLQSYFLLVGLFLPIHPYLILAHKIFDQVTGMLGHVGYEYFAGRTSRSPWPFITTLFHDQHHQYFTCNYATSFSIWDRLMGTVHPDYDDGVAAFAIGENPERETP